MNPSRTPLPGDWVTLTLRWLFMALVPVAAALLSSMEGPIVWVVITWIVYSLIVSLLQLGGWGSRLLGSISLVLDSMWGLGLIFSSGWQVSPLWWCLLLAALQSGLTRSLRVSWWTLVGGLTTASIMSLAFSRFDLWVLASALIQAALVLVGWTFLYVPVRWVRRGLENWHEKRSHMLERMRLQERQNAGQLSKLSAEINAVLDPSQIASQGLELCLMLLGEKGLTGEPYSGAVYHHQGDELVRMATTNSSVVESILLEDDLTQGLLANLLVDEQILLVNDPSSEPILISLNVIDDWCEAIIAPLKTGSSLWGLLLVGHPAPQRLGQEDLDLVGAVAQQMGVALYNAQLYADMVAERDRISEIQEEVRKKLARDLHDGPTQVVAAIAMRVNFARRLLGRDREQAADELLKVEQMARRTTKEIRHMLFTLRPLILESQGLVAALNQLVGKTIETHQQQVYLEMDSGLDTSLGLERESVVFFIAEEAINNARKHAAAAHIWIRLMQEGEWFVLEVEDDGAGFNVGAVDRDYEQRGSLGMVNMRERTELVNGELHIESTEGVGTLVRLKVPLTDEAELRSDWGASPGSEVGED